MDQQIYLSFVEVTQLRYLTFNLLVLLCKRFDFQFAHTLMRHEGIEESSIQEGKSIMITFHFIMQLMVLLELIVYVVLFLSIMAHDKSVVKIVQDDILKVCSNHLIIESSSILRFISDSKEEEHHHFGGASNHIFHRNVLWNFIATHDPLWKQHWID